MAAEPFENAAHTGTNELRNANFFLIPVFFFSAENLNKITEMEIKIAEIRGSEESSHA